MKKGFTLAELLIALTILGVIASFTIPKILTSQQDSKRKAIFRETLALLSEIVYEGQFTQGLSGQNFQTYTFSRVNALKLCQDADNDGCWTQAVPGGGNAKAGFVLHNGATVAGIDEGGGSDPYKVSFYVDWNGAALPNTEGDDQMRVRGCWGTQDCSGSPKQHTGTLMPEPGFPTDSDLYQQIFTN